MTASVSHTNIFKAIMYGWIQASQESCLLKIRNHKTASNHNGVKTLGDSAEPVYIKKK